MYETPAFNESNEKILCEMGGKNADMLMTIKVKRMAAGESFTLCSASNETAVLLLVGEAEFLFEGKSEHASRRSRFSTSPIACTSREKRQSQSSRKARCACSSSRPTTTVILT